MSLLLEAGSHRSVELHENNPEHLWNERAHIANILKEAFSYGGQIGLSRSMKMLLWQLQFFSYLVSL